MNASTNQSPSRTALIILAVLFCLGSIAIALVYPLNWTWVGPALGAVAVAAYGSRRRSPPGRDG